VSRRPLQGVRQAFAGITVAIISLLAPQAEGAPNTSRICFDVVKKVIVDQLGVEPEKVTPSADVVDDLGADDLDKVGIVMAVEAEFGTKISDRTAQGLATVGDVANELRKRSLCR
jgi:acyl carrier protein